MTQLRHWRRRRPLAGGPPKARPRALGVKVMDTIGTTRITRRSRMRMARLPSVRLRRVNVTFVNLWAYSTPSPPPNSICAANVILICWRIRPIALRIKITAKCSQIWIMQIAIIGDFASVCCANWSDSNTRPNRPKRGSSILSKSADSRWVNATIFSSGLCKERDAKTLPIQ